MEDKANSTQHHEAGRLEKEVVTEQKLSVSADPHLAAILETNKPKQWGRGYPQLYFICIVVFLCSTMNGKLASLWA